MFGGDEAAVVSAIKQTSGCRDDGSCVRIRKVQSVEIVPSGPR